jgi:hypothetical protein
MLVITALAFPQVKTAAPRLSLSFTEKAKEAFAAVDVLSSFQEDWLWHTNLPPASRSVARMWIEVTSESERKAARAIQEWKNNRELCREEFKAYGLERAKECDVKTLSLRDEAFASLDLTDWRRK